MRIPNAVLRQRIVVEDYVGNGARGPTFSPPRTIPASVQITSKLVLTWKEDEATTKTLILIRPEHGPVAVGSRITDGAVVYRVEQCLPYPDARTPSDYELTASSWEGVA